MKEEFTAKVVHPNGCCLDMGEYIIDDMNMIFGDYLGKTIKITIEEVKNQSECNEFYKRYETEFDID